MFVNEPQLPRGHKNGLEAAIDPSQGSMCYYPSNTDSLPVGNPLIPVEVYDRLPRFLINACQVFEDRYEKDVFLTSALGVLSACFDSVYGYYDNMRVNSNLFVFVIAPAASGKGSMIWARQLAQQLHERIKKTSLPSSNSEGNSFPRTLFTPANSSAAALMSHLVQNKGLALVCETEADTMAATLKQDWANYSDLYRKAFHHEVVSVSRKTGFEHAEVKNPRLSIVMTGTPGQVQRIIPSTEDGLFSRFMFYSFCTEPIWRDVSPKTQETNREEFFAGLSGVVADFSECIKDTSIEFLLQKKHWETLNKVFSEKLQNTVMSEGENTASIVKRLGLITFRTAMLLAVIRNLEEDQVVKQIECTDIDFENAIALTNVYYVHALSVYQSLPKQEATGQNLSMSNFYNALPTGKNFTSGEAVTIGGRLEIPISPRAVGNYLAILLINRRLIRPGKYGQYCKS